MNGLYQVIGEIISPVRDKINSILGLHREKLSHKMLNLIVTFILVDFSWIFFRAKTFHDALEILHWIFSVRNPWIFFDGSLYQCGLDSKNFWLMIVSIMTLLFADIMKKKNIKVRTVIASQDYWCRYLVMISAICFILIFGIWGSGYDASGFIYFQF